MHVLGASFSQRRKSSKRPRDLHIRKVSFSGSSVASDLSSSADSTTSSRTFGNSQADSAIALDPLQLHPTFSAAPPPLSERPYKKSTVTPRWEEAVSYFDDDTTDDEYDDDELIEDDDFVFEGELSPPHFQRNQKMMDLPPHASPLDHTTLEDTQQPTDYFLLQITKRPPMPRSRWSESTVHTMDSLATGSTLATPVPVAGIPNFSYKRVTVKRRPPMKGADSADNFIKRGGWKRRGIVFQNDEVRTSDVDAQAEYDFAG